MTTTTTTTNEATVTVTPACSPDAMRRKLLEVTIGRAAATVSVWMQTKGRGYRTRTFTGRYEVQWGAARDFRKGWSKTYVKTFDSETEALAFADEKLAWLTQRLVERI